MKRLAFWIVLGVVVAGVAGRHRQGHHGDWVPRAQFASFGPGPAADVDGSEASPRPPAPPKKARRPAPPRPPAKAEAPADQALTSKPQPDWFPKGRDEEEAHAKSLDAAGTRVLVGPLSSTPEKARAELGRLVQQEAATWIGGGIAWKRPPGPLFEGLVREVYVQPVAESLTDVSKDLDDIYTLYRAGARVDFSEPARLRLLAEQHRQVIRDRMLRGAGGLAFALIALATLAGYIRADEATKGSYTNRLRMLAAAGLGAGGVAIYQMLA